MMSELFLQGCACTPEGQDLKQDDLSRHCCDITGKILGNRNNEDAPVTFRFFYHTYLIIPTCGHLDNVYILPIPDLYQIIYHAYSLMDSEQAALDSVPAIFSVISSCSLLLWAYLQKTLQSSCL